MSSNNSNHFSSCGMIPPISHENIRRRGLQLQRRRWRSNSNTKYKTTARCRRIPQKLLSFETILIITTAMISLVLVTFADAGGGGFNDEIEKRVHERVTELMNVPVRMIGLVETYAKRDIFDPPFLRPHQSQELFGFLWTVWTEFGIDIYYGQEDGLFLGVIKGSGTYQEGRGTNGYKLAPTLAEDGGEMEDQQLENYEEDLYMKRLYYNQCLDRENGVTQNCTLEMEEDYIECVNDCLIAPCPSSDSSNKYDDKNETNSIIYCPTYEINQVPASYSMGYIPRYYYCLSGSGSFIENDPPNSVASPSTMLQTQAGDGVCVHTDGHTLVDGRLVEPKSYAVCDARNYMFVRNSDDEPVNADDETMNNVFLSGNDPNLVPESQKCDDVFVGGYHSRRYEPRLRPWYLGTRERQTAFWTKPYPFATNNAMGISYGRPLYYLDDNGRTVFRGVVCVDYDLEEISQYLRDIFLEIIDETAEEESDNDSTSNNSDGDGDIDDSTSDDSNSNSWGAVVLIVEDEEPHYIIGSSTGSKAAKKVRIDDETVDCTDDEIFTGVVECKTVRKNPQDLADNAFQDPADGIVAAAFAAQKEEGFPKELVVSPAPTTAKTTSITTTMPEYYVSQSLIYEQSEGENLRWRIIVAMPVSLATNDSLLLGDPMYVVVLAVGLVGCALCVFLFYYYFSKRSIKEVAVSDWRFTSAFIIGCALLNLTSLTNLGPATDPLCMLRMWSFHLCFVLALAPLLVKVWRIYKLVGSADRAIRLAITNRQAMLYTLPAILLQVFILTLFSILDPAKQYTYVDIDGSVSSQHSVCRHNTSAFAITQIVFEGGLVLAGCVLAFKTRNLGSALGEAKQLLFAMYNVALVALVLMLMGYFLAIDQKSRYVVMAVGVFWATVFGSSAFALPRLLQVHRNSRRRSGVGRSSAFGSYGSYSRDGSNHSYTTGGNNRTFCYGLPSSAVSNSSINSSGSFHIEQPKESSRSPRSPKPALIPELSMGDLLDDDLELDENDRVDSGDSNEGMGIGIVNGDNNNDGVSERDNEGKMKKRPTPITVMSTTILQAVDSISLSSGNSDPADEEGHDDDDIEENQLPPKVLETCPSQKLTQ